MNASAHRFWSRLPAAALLVAGLVVNLGLGAMGRMVPSLPQRIPSPTMFHISRPPIPNSTAAFV